MLRANAQAALENVALWHERDISHSSVERVILPDSTILLDYLQQRAIALVRGHDGRRGAHAREPRADARRAVLPARAAGAGRQGMARDDAYRVMQELAQRAWDEGIAAARAAGRRRAPGPLSLDLDEIFAYEHYVRYAKEIVGRLDAALARID